MALPGATVLKGQLVAAFNAIKLGEDNAAEKAADAIATYVDAYIKAGTVTINTTVSGTCATPSGPGTIVGSGSGTGTIS